MNIKKGLKWLHIDGKEFIIREIRQNEVVYESKETKRIYTTERKHFERYLQRANKYWNNRNKDYKNKKNKLKLDK